MIRSVFFFSLAIYLPFLGFSLIPLTGDQKTYIMVALEMKSKSSWLIPYLFNEPSFLKPPILYWSILGSWKLFGVSFFSTFLPSVLLMSSSAAAVAGITRLLGFQGQQVSRSALVFALSAGTFTFALSAQMEIALTAFFLGATYFALKYLYYRRPSDWYLGWIIAGLFGLVKSPLYSVLWALGLLVYIIYNRHFWVFRGLKGKARVALGLLVGVVTGASWYVAVWFKDPDHFVNEFIRRETISKMGGNHGSFFTLWGALLEFLLPWTLFLVPLLWFYKKQPKNGNRLLWAFGLPYAVFFSFFPYKVDTYLFVLVPLVAVTLSTVREDWLKPFSKITSIVWGVLACVLYYFLSEFPDLHWIYWGGLCLASAGCVLGFWSSTWKWMLTSMVFIVMAAQAFYVGLSQLDLRDLKNVLTTTHYSKTQPLLYYEPSPNVWSDAGLLQVSLGQKIELIHDLKTFIDRIKKGSLGIVSREFYPKPQKGIVIQLWNRLAKRSQITQDSPYREFLIVSGIRGVQ